MLVRIASCLIKYIKNYTTHKKGSLKSDTIYYNRSVCKKPLKNKNSKFLKKSLIFEIAPLVLITSPRHSLFL